MLVPRNGYRVAFVAADGPSLVLGRCRQDAMFSSGASLKRLAETVRAFSSIDVLHLA